MKHWKEKTKRFDNNETTQKEIIRFIKKYYPILSDIESNHDKIKWCKEYNAYNSTKTEDTYNLHDEIYNNFHKEAYNVGFITSYACKYESFFKDHKIIDTKIEKDQLKKLSDEQLLVIIAQQIRMDYSSNGSLINHYIADGLILHYMKALYSRILKNENKLFKNPKDFLVFIWHCIISFFSSYWLILSFYFMFDRTSVDEQEVSFIVGSFMLLIWCALYFPTFIMLTKKFRTLNSHKISPLIPSLVSITLVILSLLVLLILY